MKNLYLGGDYDWFRVLQNRDWEMLEVLVLSKSLNSKGNFDITSDSLVAVTKHEWYHL